MTLSPAQISSESVPVDPVDCVHTLEKTSPELIALSRDWERVIVDLAAIEEKISKYVFILFAKMIT
jgi:hypothetical protein